MLLTKEMSTSASFGPKSGTKERNPEVCNTYRGRSRRFEAAADGGEAQKKFGSAKAISSDQYFGPRDPDVSDLSKFGNSRICVSGGTGWLTDNACVSFDSLFLFPLSEHPKQERNSRVPSWRKTACQSVPRKQLRFDLSRVKEELSDEQI